MKAQEAKEESKIKAKKLIEQSKQGKYMSMVDKYSKHLKENPSDNYHKFATNKLNIIPKMTQTQSQSQTQKVTLSQVISPEKKAEIETQKLERNVHIQTQTQTQSQTQTITQTHSMQETGNPMMYSFGQGSGEGSHLSSSKKKGTNVNISASFGNQGVQGLQESNITFAPQGLATSQYIMGSGAYTTSENNVISSGQYVTGSKMVYSKTSTQKSNGAQLTGKYYFSTSHNTKVSKKKKEPMDTDRRKKKIEREMKAEYEIDSLDIGPRDSKRK